MNSDSQWSNLLLSSLIQIDNYPPKTFKPNPSPWGIVKLLYLLYPVQVLKGHIALGNARFPNGTNGIQVLNFSFSFFPI